MRVRISIVAGIIITALALILSVPYHAHAQGGGTGGGTTFNCDITPCGGDSTMWPWQYPPPYVIPLQLNGCQYNTPQTCCTLTCKYRTRRVCWPESFQIELLEIHYDRECAPTFDPVPMIKTITYGLLTENPMHFSPDLTNQTDTATCNSNYSVQAASCWKNVPGMKAAVNCATDGSMGYSCCKGMFKVCRKTDPVTLKEYREVTWLAQSTVANNCINDPNDPTHPCTPSCGGFDPKEGGFLPEKGDDNPGISMAPTHGTTDTITVAPAMIEPKTTLAPQQ